MDRAALLRNAPHDWRNPEWATPSRVHNWRNYATAELKAIWHTFTDDQALVVCLALDVLASGEGWD